MRRGRPATRKAAASPATGADGAAAVVPTDATGAGDRDRPKRSTELRTLPGRLEWNAAMARESARSARYHRPASIVIVELRHQNGRIDVTPFMKSLAGPVSRVLRDDCRATDLVARVATARFQLLLPETAETGAERLADRLATGCRAFIERTGAPIAIRVSVAGTGLQDSLQDALAHALRAIEAA